MQRSSDISSLGAFAALRAEKGLLTAFALILLLAGLLFPVAAVSLETHSGLSIDLSLCRTLSLADTDGDGELDESFPVADGPMCVCPGVCGSFCYDAPGMLGAAFVPDSLCQSVATSFSATCATGYFKSALRPEVRGPPHFT